MKAKNQFNSDINSWSLPDLSDDIVRIYYWKPSSPSETGHISLKTSQIYASFWPVDIPELKSVYTIQGQLQSYQEDIVREGRDGGRDSGIEDEFIDIHGLDVEEINERFTLFESEVRKGNIRWSLLSHRWLDQYYPIVDRNNCSSLVTELLEAGGIRRWVSDRQEEETIIIKVGPLLMVYSSLMLATSSILRSETGMVFGLPICFLFEFMNRNKRHNAMDPTFSIVDSMAVLPVCFLCLFAAVELINVFSDNFMYRSYFSLIIISLLFIPCWYVSRRISRLIKFLVLCCKGTDVLIRPAGIYEFAKYIKEIAQVKNNIKSDVTLLLSSAYTVKAGPIWVIMLLGRYVSNNYIIGVNQGSLIGFHVGILLGTLLNLFFRKRCNIRDELKQNNQQSSIEIAQIKRYLLEALDDPLYMPSFSTTVFLGTSWGAVIAGYFFKNNRSYVPWENGIGSLVGFVIAALGHQLTKTVINIFKSRRKQMRQEIAAGVDVKEEKYPQRKSTHSSENRSLLDKSLSHGHYALLSFPSAQTNELGEEELDKHSRQSKCCLIL